MLYKPLDEKRNEVRVLQFCSRPPSESTQGPIQLAIENVSLDRWTDKYHRHQRDNPTDMRTSWQDKYTEAVDLRHCKDNRSSVVHRGHAKSWNGRFSWGDFETLSYAWGEPDESRIVLLNGVSKPISATLDLALRQLWRLPETEIGMRFWIDALCINQQDTIERNHQVKRMKHIYSVARAVVVWLGPASEGDKRAFRIMNHTYRDTYQNNRLIIPATVTRDDWDALCAFIKKPYWSRLWIIQELAANHHSTLFLCGKTLLTREMLKKGADCCQKLLREDSRFSQRVRSDTWFIATRVYRLVSLSLEHPLPSMLNNALSLARQAEARDPRDKVFGILGLLDKSISSKIVPDYRKSVQDIFTDMTMAIIRATRRLEQIIYRAELLESEWPSWVPDLRVPFPRQNVKSLRRRRASGHSYAQFEFVAEVGTSTLLLCCKGYKIDSIDGIAASSQRSLPILPDSNQTHTAKQSTRSLHRTLVLDHPKTYRRPALMKLPWIAQCSSQKEYTLSSPPAWERVFVTRHFKEFHRFREANKDFRIGHKDFKDFFSSSTRNISKTHALTYHLSLAVHSLRKRKLATTKGGYIAMVPRNVKRGDVVIVLLGCNFPVLVRPCGLYFRVLGECYVHGLMDGQVFGLAKSGKTSLVDLKLC
jgi:hypothetical protein